MDGINLLSAGLCLKVYGRVSQEGFLQVGSDCNLTKKTRATPSAV